MQICGSHLCPGELGRGNFLSYGCFASGGLKRKSVVDFWTDADFAMGKAHEVIFVDDLKPLTSKPSNELMSSYIYRAI